MKAVEAMLAAGAILLTGCEGMDAPVVETAPIEAAKSANPPSIRAPVAGPESTIQSFVPWDSNRTGVRKLPSGVEVLVLKQGEPLPSKLTGKSAISFTVSAWASKIGGGPPFTLAQEPVTGGLEGAYSIDQFVPGLQEGMQDMGRGERRAVFVPARLAYGPPGMDRIPPNADVVFDIELIAVK